jgi:uncharacterized membrane protein
MTSSLHLLSVAVCLSLGLALGWLTQDASPLAVMAVACGIVLLFLGARAASRFLERISL